MASGSGTQEPLLYRQTDSPLQTQEPILSPNESDDERDEPSQGHDIREMQQAINQHHPFGLKIWKPSLYKKFRSVQFTAYNDLHQNVEDTGSSFWKYASLGNILWTLLFSWWIALKYLMVAIVLLALVGIGALGSFLIYPFVVGANSAMFDSLLLAWVPYLVNFMSWVCVGLQDLFPYVKVYRNSFINTRSS
jgi:hypothetical protein